MPLITYPLSRREAARVIFNLHYAGYWSAATIGVSQVPGERTLILDISYRSAEIEGMLRTSVERGGLSHLADRFSNLIPLSDVGFPGTPCEYMG